jgi:hypothetical protein
LPTWLTCRAGTAPVQQQDTADCTAQLAAAAAWRGGGGTPSVMLVPTHLVHACAPHPSPQNTPPHALQPCQCMWRAHSGLCPHLNLTPTTAIAIPACSCCCAGWRSCPPRWRRCWRQPCSGGARRHAPGCCWASPWRGRVRGRRGRAGTRIVGVRAPRGRPLPPPSGRRGGGDVVGVMRIGTHHKSARPSGWPCPCRPILGVNPRRAGCSLCPRSITQPTTPNSLHGQVTHTHRSAHAHAQRYTHTSTPTHRCSRRVRL